MIIDKKNAYRADDCHPESIDKTQKNHQNGCMYTGTEFTANIPVLKGILARRKLPSSNRSQHEDDSQLHSRRLKQFEHDDIQAVNE